MTQCLFVELVVLAFLTFSREAVGPAAADQDAHLVPSAGVTRPWPCRIVVEPPLLQLVDRAWNGSTTFRRQCEALAARGAIAILWPGAEQSGSKAVATIGHSEDGVVVGRVKVPLNTDTLECIAHEMEHILERAEGVDMARESRRKDSGVWRALNGFESQRAIDVGRQVAREVREGSPAAR